MKANSAHEDFMIRVIYLICRHIRKKSSRQKKSVFEGRRLQSLVKDYLEQWIYLLSTSEITEDATAPGLVAAREKMKIETMSREDQDSYFRHLDDAVVLVDNIKTARNEGILEGRVEGRIEEKIKIAQNLIKIGLDIESIKIATGFSESKIEKYRISIHLSNNFPK